jgi:hypothetical protein
MDSNNRKRGSEMSKYKIMRIAAAFALSSMLVTVAGASIASASSTTTTTTTATALAPPPPSAPAGCGSGYFCSYKNGNGGNLCFSTTATSNLSPGCNTDIDSSYNNMAVNNELFYGSGESGAYYLLGAGNYLLYMSANSFNTCLGGGTSCTGYNTVMQNHVYSVYVP